MISERTLDLLLDTRLYHGAPYAMWQRLKFQGLMRSSFHQAPETPLNICVTVDLECDYRNPASASASQVFLPRFFAFCSAHNINTTFYCQGDIVPKVASDLRGIDMKRHELGLHGLHHEVWGRARWMQYSLGYPSLTLTERKRRLVRALGAFEDAGLPRPRAFRAPYLNIDQASLHLLYALGFRSDSSPASFLGAAPIPRKVHGLWQVPVTSRPYPSMRPRGLQLFEYPELTLGNLLAMPAHELTDLIDLARVLQAVKGFPAHIVMLLHPWEFATHPQVPYANPQNYERLGLVLDRLSHQFPVRMLTMSQLIHRFASHDADSTVSRLTRGTSR